MSALSAWAEKVRRMGHPAADLGDLLRTADDDTAEALWVVLRPGYLVALLVAGWGVDVCMFGRFHVDYEAALGLGKDEALSPQRLWILACAIGVALGCFRLLLLSQLPTPLVLWSVLCAYLLALSSLFVWLPAPLARHVRWRVPLGRALWRCVWPQACKEVPFIEVLVADGLTSIAKAFFDLALGSCVALSSAELSAAAFLGGSLLDGAHVLQDGPDLLFNSTTPLPRPRLGEALRECKRSPLPFLAWAGPFLIRARQCVVTARHAPDSLSRDLQRVNLLKYLSALPVIFFALCYARSGPHFSWLVFGADDFEAMWAMAAMVNSIFSFLWDMVMDWGLLQPAPWHSIHFGLRPVLLFRGSWGFYHVAIIGNLLGRTLWSLRWSPQATVFLGSFFLASIQQFAEVLRRSLWNVLRVEWECIKKNVHRVDKHFPV